MGSIIFYELLIITALNLGLTIAIIVGIRRITNTAASLKNEVSAIPKMVQQIEDTMPNYIKMESGERGRLVHKDRKENKD